MKKPPPPAWHVYIIQCSDDTLYTGISNNVRDRIKQHNSGNGAKYTKGRLPVKLVYLEKYATRSDASKREYKIKQLPRAQKLTLING